jgi:hypothetical protein
VSYFLKRGWFLYNNPKFLFKSSQSCKQLRQPILLISLPRSGSSWIGEVLGSGNEALYLREPFTRTYMQKVANAQTVCSLPTIENQTLYYNLIERTFNGHPNFTRTVIPHVNRWFEQADDKVRVIKEVNPLILDYVLERYHPKVIFLARHPAAVALSSFVQGWTKNNLQNKFTKEEFSTFSSDSRFISEGAFWTMSGQAQGIVQSVISKSLANYPDKIVLKYEDACENPHDSFKQIFDFAGLAFDQQVQDDIASTSKSNGAYNAGQYDTKRDSKSMPKKWKNKITEADLNNLQQAYLQWEPTLYPATEW